MNGDPSRENALQANYARLLARIEKACRRSRRSPGSVQLVAVSKTFGAESVLALAELGQRAFGENYVQEALGKMALCRERRPELRWHFIGPIQSNKTRQIAEQFDWVHSVEREKVAVRLGEQRPARLAALDCCIQVNVSGEASKSGCAPDAALALACAIVAQPRLRLRGLMAIPESRSDEAVLRLRFATLRRMLEEIRQGLSGDWPEAARALDTLSMGMSADLEVAIDEGATLVRVGSALFGARPAAVVRDR